jgi:hypothetical protein
MAADLGIFWPGSGDHRKADRKAFETLRFAGDALPRESISAILPVEPIRATAKARNSLPRGETEIVGRVEP